MHSLSHYTVGIERLPSSVQERVQGRSQIHTPALDITMEVRAFAQFVKESLWGRPRG